MDALRAGPLYGCFASRPALWTRCEQARGCFASRPARSTLTSKPARSTPCEQARPLDALRTSPPARRLRVPSQPAPATAPTAAALPLTPGAAPQPPCPRRGVPARANGAARSARLLKPSAPPQEREHYGCTTRWTHAGGGGGSPVAHLDAPGGPRRAPGASERPRVPRALVPAPSRGVNVGVISPRMKIVQP